MISNEAKVVTLDIETSPLKVSVWRLGEQRVNIDQVLEDWHIMAWSAKKLNSQEVIYREARKPSGEKRILKALWTVLDEADIVISQNGEAFDLPKIESRMMLHGLKPFSPIKHHDTYKQLKKIGFTSHKLEYLTDKFCKKYKKLKHKKFPGLSLWKECLKGNPEAWKEMRVYNTHDVLSTEELYLNTRGWSTNKAPVLFWYKDPTRRCAYCGEYRLQKRGIERTTKKIFHRAQCQACGKFQRLLEIKHGN